MNIKEVILNDGRRLLKGKLIEADGTEKKANNFETNILLQISDYDVKQYADDYLDMINKDDTGEHCDCTVGDYSDGDIVNELKSRNMPVASSVCNNLITSELFARFEAIIDKISPFEVADLLTEIEKKNNIL